MPPQLAAESDDRHRRNSIVSLFEGNSTIHGIRDLLVSRRIDLKIIWTVLLTLAAVLTANGCYEVLYEYLDKQVIVSYFAHSNDTLEVPNLVICPLARFNRSYFDRFGMSKDLRQYVELSYPGGAEYFDFQRRTTADILSKFYDLDAELRVLLSRQNLSFTQFANEAAISCTGILDEDVCATATTSYTSFGKCFEVETWIQNRAGPGYGRVFMVRLPKKHFNPGATIYPNDGIIVKLSAPGKEISTDDSFIPIGTHALVEVRATQYNFLHQPPHFSCMEGDTSNYSQTWCLEACYIEKAEFECDCSIAASTQRKYDVICSPKEIYECYLEKLPKGDEYLAVRKACNERCLSPCEYWEYTKTMSYAPYPSENYRELISSQEEYDDLKKSIVIELFYPNLEYLQIKHVRSLTFWTFISQFGGQLSLWAGASIMSVIQLVVYVVFMIWSCLRLRMNKNKFRSVTNMSKFAVNPLFDVELVKKSIASAAAFKKEAKEREAREQIAQMIKERKDREMLRKEQSPPNEETPVDRKPSEETVFKVPISFKKPRIEEERSVEQKSRKSGEKSP